MVLGSSVCTVAQAVAAQSEGADYIGVCSIYPTTSKEVVEVVGLDGLRQIRQAVTMPLVALGGVNEANVSDVLAAGADSVAVINAVLGAEDVEKASLQIVEGIKNERIK